MFCRSIRVTLVCVVILSGASIGFAQSEKEGFALIKEGSQLLNKAASTADVGTALKKFQEALLLFEGLNSDKGKGYAHNNIGQVYLRLGQYSKALEAYEKALSVKKKISDVKGEGASISGIGSVYYAQGNYTKALEYFERHLEISRKINDANGQGNALNNIGMVSQSLGQYPRALKHYEQSLEIKKKLGDVRGEGTALNNIGYVYIVLGEYPKAMEYFEQSLKNRQSTGDLRGEAAVLVNTGEVCRALGHYPKALEYHERSLEIRKKVGDVRGEANSLVNIGLVYNALGKYSKALDYYNHSLEINEKIGNVKGKCDCLNNIGNVYYSRGQYPKALENQERSLEIKKKIGDVAGQSSSLNNIGNVYLSLGQYPKALDNYERSIEIKKRLGDVRGEGLLLSNMGIIYKKLGQYTKALEYYKHSLEIRKRLGDSEGEGTTYSLLGTLYTDLGKYSDARLALEKALQINKSIGKPTRGVENNLANLFLDSGDLTGAEKLINSAGYDSTRARLSLLKKDYASAAKYYEKGMAMAEKTGNSDGLFISYTGMATTNEAMENYEKAEEYYEKAMNLLEEVRSGLLPSERKNFFEVKMGGFSRIEPAKGLTRVRMKLNRQDGGIQALEVTKARAFADHLSETTASGASGVPKETMEKEQSLVNRLAALKKELAKTDRLKQSARYEILSGETKDAEADLSSFVDNLSKNYPSYAAVKYPRPIGIKDSGLEPKECLIMFDVSSSGVMIKLIRNRQEAESFFKKWDSEDLAKDVMKFRAPFENKKLREFDPELAESLYRKLLQAVLVDVPKGTPLVIIPDGILAGTAF